ncbi:YybH family protein [Jiangella anatolica]|uniref:DUF4440 domain-containing protein n=1 Tax=Jiangella anatolica TaxID=2670374 RepID=A0A2W2B6T2_9ACTN|nr:nuclear transport factor 2 family protein [Jiangella anatolica]PZF83171.1 DUF4440 domain-containing protein [Jiangella anatolica]
MDTIEITELLDERSAAIHAKDLDRLMSFYTDDIVYFDLVPPLHYVGADALRDRFTDWFTRWDGPIGQQPAEVHVESGGDVAVVRMLIRASGTLVTGRQVDYWVRATDGLRRTAGRWQIAHEHVSLPVELPQGTAAMDLRPDG